jgi:hypothetical protein
MKRLLPALLILGLLATSACLSQSLKQGGAQDMPAAGSGDSTGAGQNNFANNSDGAAPLDVNKTLDEVLSKPIETPVKEAPKLKPKAEPVLQGQTKIENADTANSKKEDESPVNALEFLRPKPSPYVLKGGAAFHSVRGDSDQDDPDPDLGNDELQIEWSAWRNRFLRSVQMQVQASVNNPDLESGDRPRLDPFTRMPKSRFPLGTVAWFACQVTNDRRIARVVITESSGIREYDRAVIEGIRALDGTTLLTFPRDSRRTSVHQEAGIQTAAQSRRMNFDFHDVERYSVPRGY